MRLGFRRRGLRFGLLGLFVGSVMLTLLVGSSAAAPVCGGGTCTETFAFTGAAQTWTVPTGVTQATFDAYGAEGGGTSPGFAQGGRGGHATADLTLSPGATVTIVVGGSGGAVPNCGGGAQSGVGGFNGGATGGAPGSGNCPGAGGGGASDVRIGGSGLAARMLVAGGGGGAAPVTGPFGFANGGGGGGLNGQAGNAADVADDGGSGGDQTGASGSGQLGDGSAGTDQGTEFTAGGGGGGGYYGGAGGPNLAGGGGGSGFGPAGVSFETGVRLGNGVVTITYTEPPPCTPTGFFRDGINLTAKQIGGNVTGTLDATGCNIGVYYGPGTTGTVGAGPNPNEPEIFGANYYGVVNNAAAVNIEYVSIHDIGESPLNGSQHGVGVLYTTINQAGASTGASATGAIDHADITNYQKNGIVISGTGASAQVSLNTVQGEGPISYIAQNGIQVSFGGSAKLFGNVVTLNNYTPAKITACGLLLFKAGGVSGLTKSGISYIKADNMIVQNETDICNFGKGGAFSPAS
jgi:hypothetical protein